MMKVIIAPDKFKGSLTSIEAAAAIAAGILQVDSKANIVSFPMADGGDGFAAVMQHYLHTETVACLSADPLGRPMRAAYQWSAADKTAIIEMAVASGLVLLQPHERNPLKTSSYGTGLLVKDAIARGAVKIILGLGGSATNDAGTGILAALGFELNDSVGNVLEGRGEDLALIQSIVPPAFLPAVDFQIACDVQNPLYGPQGAAYIYAPQKGADPVQTEQLDKGLRHFAAIIEKQTGIQVADIPGAGAAGGIAAALIPFLGAKLSSGTELIIAASGITAALNGAKLVITGEGKIDEQTKAGKLPQHIAQLARERNTPVIAFCGTLQLDEKGIKELGLNYASAIKSKSMSTEESMAHGAELLTREAARVFDLFINNEPMQ
jgi:glycerate kinase